MIGSTWATTTGPSGPPAAARPRERGRVLDRAEKFGCAKIAALVSASIAAAHAAASVTPSRVGTSSTSMP